MVRPWLREEQADLAVEKILEGASVAFLERGVSRTSMSDIAKCAGCSRGTLYRYFENRHQLHLAYVNQQARALSARVRAALADVADPRERLVEGVMRSVREVRETPGTAAWFSEGDAGLAVNASRHSQVVGALVTGFIDDLLGAGDSSRRGSPVAQTSRGAESAESGNPGGPSEHDRRLRAKWLLRVVVSLLSMPGESEAEERELVSRFAVPAVFDAA